MGLLDGFDKITPQQMGLLSAGLALMQPTQSGRLGESLGNAGQALIGGMSTAQKMQAEKLKQQQMMQQQKMQQQMMQRIGSGFGGGGGGGSGAGLSQSDLAQYAMMGGDGASNLIDLYKFNQAGIKRDSGSYYKNPMTGEMTYMPKIGEGMTMGQDGVALNTPGYLESVTAQERAKAGVADWLDAQKQYRGAALDPVQTYNPNTGNMEYSNRGAIAQGAMGGGGAQGGGGAIAAQNPAAAKYDAERAAAMSKLYDEFIGGSNQANQQLAIIDRMAALQNDMNSGRLAPTLKELSSLAQTAGITLDAKLGDKEAFESLSNQLAIAMRQPGTGVMTDKDMEVFKASVPSLQQSPTGNIEIMSTMRKFAQRQQKEAEFAAKYQQKHGRIDDRFISQLQNWRQQNPITWNGKPAP